MEPVVAVTFNTRHFPSEILAPFGVVALEPDGFVHEFMDRDDVVSAAAEHRTSLHR